jgi:hypothetical protein
MSIKGPFGYFGQSEGFVLCGSQSLVHLTHSSAYLNWAWYHFVTHVTNGGGVLHIQASCADMFFGTSIEEKLWS